MQASLKILIIDDDQEILELLIETFSAEGHQITTAISGYAAIRILEKNTYDIIISDYRMANGNGMIVLNHVSLMKKKPIFYFFSGQADVSIEECLKAGATKFFSKPFDFEPMFLEIEKISFIF